MYQEPRWAGGKLDPVDAETLRKSYRENVERRLEQLLPPLDRAPHRLHEAMRYSCLGPGKRLRPALCLAACECTCGNAFLALDAACGIEMIHVFSLIHDDLPAVDDDDMRRGRPSCHKMYGEALAILAGDALFALGFQCVAQTNANPAAIAQSLMLLAESSGSNGLVGGEVLDIEAEGQSVNAQELETIHLRKTGALIAASCAVGGLIGGGANKSVESLYDFGLRIGLAFQITDDILNELGDAASLGKASGSDRARNKATYPALHGIDASKKMAQQIVAEAIDRIRVSLPSCDPLISLARYAIDRVN